VVIYLNTTFKSLASILHVSWFITAKTIIQRLDDTKMQMDYKASSLSQLILTKIIARGNYTAYTKRLQH
jgi:GntR family transcriptional regulator of abcA and norABC